MDYRDRFRDQGYLSLPQFYSVDEVAAMRTELTRLRNDGRFRNVAKDSAEPAANLQICPMSPHSRLFRAMPFDDKVVAMVRALIGDPVVLHLDQVFLKPARRGVGTGWHQDNAYFKIEDPLQGTGMWVAVHEATVENGTLHVIPESFRGALSHDRDPGSVKHIRCYPDEAHAIPIELPAGGVVFFSYGTAHCTRANRTEHDRAGVALHFLNAAAIAPHFYWAGDPMKHPHLTGSAADGGLAAYGERFVWEREVVNLSRCAALRDGV